MQYGANRDPVLLGEATMSFEALVEVIADALSMNLPLQSNRD